MFSRVLSRHVIHGDVSEVGTDQSDRSRSARRAWAALIRVICNAGEPFSRCRFLRIQLVLVLVLVLAVGGLMDLLCVSLCSWDEDNCHEVLL